jgi:transcriptional regulator with XRE-family HTH domain
MKIGKVIREFRLARNMSIKELSEKTNLTSSLISQVERDLISPSLNSLAKISGALKVPIVSFFTEATPKPWPVMRKKQRKKTTIFSSSHVIYQLLSPDPDKKIELLLVEIEPEKDENDGNELVTHSGEECGYVIKGELEVRLGKERYYLKEGDSIYFQSRIPHRFKNTGKEKVISIWAMTPPSFWGGLNFFRGRELSLKNKQK